MNCRSMVTCGTRVVKLKLLIDVFRVLFQFINRRPNFCLVTTNQFLLSTSYKVPTDTLGIVGVEAVESFKT